MRRHIKRMADIARIAGIVLICLSVVLSIYITASIGGPWRDFSDRLGDKRFMTRLDFDGTYYRALSRAVADRGLSAEARAANARACFSAFEDRLMAREAAANAEAAADLWKWFDESMDTQAFLALHESAEGGEDDRQIAEAVAFLDSLTVVKAKGKAAKLKPASVEPYFREAYEALSAAQGEAAGTYAEYLTAVWHMIETDQAAGVAVKDAKDWHAGRFDENTYAEALRTVLSQERAASASLSDRVAEAIQSGEKPGDALRAIREQLGEVDEVAFLTAMRELLMDPNFDGSEKTLRARMEEIKAARSAESAEAFMEAWGERLVHEADDRALVGVVGAFWRVVSWFVSLWIIGIALVLIGLIADRLLSRHMLRVLDKTGIQEDPDVLLRVEHLCQYFRDGDHVGKAVDDVSFFVKKGEVFGLVGESGCGKTTTGRTIINLYNPTAGDVYFEGLRISSTKNSLPVLSYSLRKDARTAIEGLREEMRERQRQNPGEAAAIQREYAEKISAVRKKLSADLAKAQNHALESEAEKNRAETLYRKQRKEQLTRAFEAEKAGLSGQALEDRKRRYELEMKAAGRDNMMTRMQMIFQDPIASIDPRMTVREIIAEGLRIRGIHDKQIIDKTVYEMLDLVGLVSEHADRYPHEFSGGQRQRIGIARAIALEPELIIADEPISALDVSIQAQVINLMNDLRRRMGLTIIFIAHNLSVVKYFSDRIAVMYFGNIVEMTTADELFAHPLHPYTQSLLSAIPYPDPYYEKQRKRLEYNPTRQHDYSVDKPSFREVKPGHWVRCNEAEYNQYRRELGL